MKRYFLYVLAIAITLISCNKENLSPNSNFQSITVKSQLENSSKNASSSITIEGVKTLNDMLWFKDLESYESALEKLSAFQDNEIDNFNNKYFVFTNEELEKMSIEEKEKAFDELQAKESEIGFSEEGVYINFEEQLNFKSLRKSISDLEIGFLNNENPDWENNPDAHFIPFTNERTLLNQFGEIKIGEHMYILKENFSMRVIDADYETAVALRTLSSGYDKFENVEFDNIDGSQSSYKSSASCHYSSAGGKSYPSSTSTKKIVGYVGVRNSFFGIGNSRAYAKTTNYQKKNCCKYIKKKASTKAKVSGSKCGNSSGTFSTSTLTKNRKSLTQIITIGNKNVGGTNLSGYHKGINNYATNSSH